MLPAVLLCVALGVWQVERLRWKEGLIAKRETALSAAPIALPQSLAGARQLEFHRVVANGVFLGGKEILLHAIGPQGGIGFDVLAPLREASGRVVFVKRGYVPTDLREQRKPIVRVPEGEAQVSGLLRLLPPDKPGWFLPDNRPADHEWFWIDLAAMARADGFAVAAPFYIDTNTAPPPLPNNHLQYAITWFSLAAVGLVIYVLSQRGR